MAAQTGAYKRFSVVNEAEDVRDIIYDVSPEETPGVTNAPVATADNTLHGWINDELDDAVNTNAHLDGDVFTGETITAPSKLTNECQIFRKDIVVTRRARKLAKYGPTDELARQVTRKGRELKRDIEKTMWTNQARVSDANGSTVPKLAGVPTWIIGVTDGRADRGATAGADPASLGAVKTDGDPRVLDESAILDVVKSIWDVSSEIPNVIQMTGGLKVNFSAYMFSANSRIATQYQDQGKSPRGGVTVVGAVDVWVTDFAVLDVVPNRFIPDNDVAGETEVHIYNTSMLDIAYFDSIQTNAMAKTGDTDDRMVLADLTIVPRNPKCLGVYSDAIVGTMIA